MSLRLSRGALIEINGELCEVRRFFPDRVEIQEVRSGRVLSPTHAEVDEMFVDGRVAFPPDPPSGRAGRVPVANDAAPDLAALPENTRRELDRRLSYVRPFLALPAVRRTAARAAEFLAGYPEEENSGDGRRRSRPKPRTLLLWCQRFGRGGPGALLALAPKYWRSGRSCPPEHDAVETIVAEVLRDTLMRTERPTVAFAYARIQNRIEAENKVRVPAAHLREPSRASVHRRARTLIDPYELAKAREGKRAADRQFAGVKRGARANRPRERVIMDHTVVDVIVVDDRERPLFVGRPTLTVLIDVFSRCIVGFFLSFEPPSFAQAAIALRRAILPKVRLGSAGLRIKHSWPCSGVMETLVVDNGKEFHSEGFRTACALLGITLAYAPIRKPEWKAIGERFFGTLNTRGIHCIPGTTRSNPQDRGEYRSADEARFTLAELEALLTKIIVDDYHETIHSSLERPPAAVYAERIAEAAPAPLKDARELRIALGLPEKRQIRPEGIVHKRLWYTEGLDALRRRLGNGTEVEIRVDPLDVGRIQVLDPDARRFVEGERGRRRRLPGHLPANAGRSNAQVLGRGIADRVRRPGAAPRRLGREDVAGKAVSPRVRAADDRAGRGAAPDGSRDGPEAAGRCELVEATIQRGRQPHPPGRHRRGSAGAPPRPAAGTSVLRVLPPEAVRLGRPRCARGVPAARGRLRRNAADTGARDAARRGDGPQTLSG